MKIINARNHKQKNHRKYLKIAVYLWLITPSVFLSAIVPHLEMVDTPTAATLPRGTYDISFWGYTNGGILTKATIGLHNNIYLGVSLDLENAIGDLKPKFNIPGVIAKIKFTDGWEYFPLLIAIGYDSFYSGSKGKTEQETTNPFNQVIFGPYFVLTKPVFLFEMEQHFHIGVRLPAQPIYEPRDASLFLAFDFPLGFFVPMFEIERIYFDTNRLSEILYNIGLRFNLIEDLALELNFMMTHKETPNRMVVLEFHQSF